MGVRLCCDGCDCDLDLATATKRGTLVEVFYCDTCAATHDDAEKQVDILRTKMATAFEIGRRSILQDARQALKRLPDE